MDLLCFFLSWFAMPLCVCLYVPCSHLLVKGCPLGSRLWCPTVCLSLFHWYPGSDLVLDCIDSLSLHPYLHGQANVWLVSGEIGDGKAGMGLIDGQLGDGQEDVRSEQGQI